MVRFTTMRGGESFSSLKTREGVASHVTHPSAIAVGVSPRANSKGVHKLTVKAQRGGSRRRKHSRRGSRHHRKRSRTCCRRRKTHGRKRHRKRKQTRKRRQSRRRR